MIYPIGTLIADNYEVVEVLAGGMGVVYLCLDHLKDLPVALKTFKPEYLSNRAARDRFLREGTIWVDLGYHPHIVRAHHIERIGNGREVYLVLEWVAKADESKRDASLRAWLRPGRPMPIEQALLFTLHIARGMKYATTKIPGLAHRDLKPDNILIGRDKYARITDFGLAKFLQEQRDILNISPDDEKQHTTSSAKHIRLTKGIVGTPEYMAPEQWEEQQEVKAQADIYALGCILVEMLTGQIPVRAKPRSACRQLHQSGQALKAAWELPEAVIPLLIGCLVINPDHRYGNWAEVEGAVAETYYRATNREVPSEPIEGDETEIERLATGWSYNVLGLAYWDMGKFDIAANYFERVVQIGRAVQARNLEGYGLGNLGNVFRDQGDLQQAIGYIEQDLAITREIGDRQGEGAALGNLGSTYAKLGNIQRAIELYQQALEINQEIGDRTAEAMMVGNIGTAYLAVGETRQALKFFEQNLIIAREIKDRYGEGASLGNIGMAYHALGDAQRAIEFFEQALVIAREIGDRAGEGRILGNLGGAYKNLGDIQRSIGLVEQALVIAREVGDRMEEGKELVNLGAAYGTSGDRRQAITFYEQALAITQEVGDRATEGQTLSNLGSWYRELGKIKQAIECFEQALVIAQEIGNKVREGHALSGLGTAYISLGNAPQAIEFFEQALAIAQELEDQPGEAIVRGNLGITYHSLGDVSQAIELLEQAIAIAQQTGNILRGAEFSLNMAAILFEQGQPDKALPHIEYAVQMFTQVGHKQHAHEAKKLLDLILSAPEGNPSFNIEAPSLTEEDIAFLEMEPISRKRMDLLWLDPPHLAQLEQPLAQHKVVTVTIGDGSSLREHEVTLDDYLWAKEVERVVDVAYAAGQEERYHEAIQYYKEALQLAPGCDLFLMSLGALYAQLGKKWLGLHYLERAAEISPGNIRIRDNLVNARKM